MASNLNKTSGITLHKEKRRRKKKRKWKKKEKLHIHERKFVLQWHHTSSIGPRNKDMQNTMIATGRK